MECIVTVLSDVLILILGKESSNQMRSGTPEGRFQEIGQDEILFQKLEK